jgi:hypothetical protein
MIETLQIIIMLTAYTLQLSLDLLTNQPYLKQQASLKNSTGIKKHQDFVKAGYVLVILHSL